MEVLRALRLRSRLLYLLLYCFLLTGDHVACLRLERDVPRAVIVHLQVDRGQIDGPEGLEIIRTLREHAAAVKFCGKFTNDDRSAVPREERRLSIFISHTLLYLDH